MRTRLPAALLVLGLLIWGAWLRLHGLGDRPMHTDEAVQAVKTGDLLEHGHYRYDPVEYHGPVIYYLALLPARLAGARTLAEMNETMLRTVPAAAGLLLLLVLLGLAREWDRPSALCALGFAALSPSGVFYSRYFIQEMWLLLGTAGLAWCLFGYARARTARWAVGAGLFAGLMHISKETCVLTFAGVGLGLLVTMFKERWRPERRDWRNAGLAVLAGAALSVVFFSSFFTNARGPLDSVLTYLNYSGKADHSEHEHSWLFYARLLGGWHERGGPWFQEIATLAFALLAVILHFLRPKQPGTAGARAIAFAFVVIAAAYFSFDYKTPWLILNLLLPLHLLAGWGVASLWRALPHPAARGVFVLLLALAAADFQRQNHFANTRFPAGPRNPFAYVHTGRDLPRLAEQILAVAALGPPAEEVAVQVMASEYWPLPWYLRSLKNVGYWYELQPGPRAAIVVTSPEFADQVADLESTHKPVMAGLRPGAAVHVWYRKDLWERYVEGRK